MLPPGWAVKAPLAVCASVDTAEASVNTATHAVRVLDIGPPLEGSDSKTVQVA
jgi:hypothetical protein